MDIRRDCQSWLAVGEAHYHDRKAKAQAINKAPEWLIPVYHPQRGTINCYKDCLNISNLYEAGWTYIDGKLIVAVYSTVDLCRGYPVDISLLENYLPPLQKYGVMETRALTKTFESEGAPVRALRGVDFTMAAGEFVAIMGPSGCGKSTLLNLAAGLDTPTDGEIVVAGESLAGKDENDLSRMRRAHIGIVFQFFNLLEGMSVLENVTLPAVIAGLSRRRAETRARDLLDLLGLADKAGTPPACCRVASGSAWPSPGRWPTNRRSCWPTSRPAPSTRRADARCSSCSGASTPTARRSCS